MGGLVVVVASGEVVTTLVRNPPGWSVPDFIDTGLSCQVG